MYVSSSLFCRQLRYWWKRRDRDEVWGELPRQTLKECEDFSCVRVRERHAKLDARHDPDGFRQGRNRPVVKVRRRHHDVAQARNAEDVKIIGIVGNVETPLVDGLATRRLP